MNTFLFRQSCIVCCLWALTGFLLVGCSARYIDSADAHIAQVPVISGTVPQERGNTFFLGAYASQSSASSLRTSTGNRQPENYGVDWSPTSVGFNFGTRINTSDGLPGKVSMIDLFTYVDGNPNRFIKNNAVIIGAGATTSFRDFRIRLATGIGRHQYDIVTVLVTDPSELCSQNCETTIDTSFGNFASPIILWSATVWPTPYEKGAFTFAPFLGFQYGLQFVSGQSSAFGESLSLRNPIVSFGVRTDWGSNAIIAEFHSKKIYNAHGGTAIGVAEIRLEQALNFHKEL